MRNFVLREMMLLSYAQKAARKINFHPETTIILGANDTGKSCLVKSIYRAFGAEPAKTHPSWREALVIAVVRFEIDGIKYSILQDQSFYALFDSRDSLIRTFKSVTNELGPYLSDLLDFKIKLINKQNQAITPPPAYCFLPFYVDQDGGWNRPWSSFRYLNHFSDWKLSLAEYHTGIRPNSYYELKSALNQLEQKAKELDSEIRVT